MTRFPFTAQINGEACTVYQDGRVVYADRDVRGKPFKPHRTPKPEPQRQETRDGRLFDVYVIPRGSRNA